MVKTPDILILYALADDARIDNNTPGWVTHFHKYFSTLFAQITGTEAQIELINEESLKVDVIDRVSLVIAIITPQFVGQNYLVSLLNRWMSRVKESDNYTVEGIHRLFKVYKKPYDSDNALPELAEIISYDLFHVDPLTGDAREFRRFFGVEAERGFWMKLVDLAYDINTVLKSDVDENQIHEVEKPREKTVYLASTGVDMVIQRDIIKRELKRHGYDVLPKSTLPKEVVPLEAMIREDLTKCRLSIHLIGEDYGLKPAGSEVSVVDLQNRIASEHTQSMKQYNRKASKQKPFSRLIWLSPDLKNVSERQKLFIEDIKSDASSHDESEVLQINLQELKTIIREELVTGGRFKIHDRARNGREEEEDDSTKSIYLIHDKSDADKSKKLEKFLTKIGYKVLAPSYEGDIVDIRFVHQENLRRCDGSIIYYGNASKDWIKTKLQDLLKAPGFGRKKPMRARAIYMEGHKDMEDENMQKYKALILEEKDGFNADNLKPFLARLEK